MPGPAPAPAPDSAATSLDSAGRAPARSQGFSAFDEFAPPGQSGTGPKLDVPDDSDAGAEPDGTDAAAGGWLLTTYLQCVCQDLAKHEMCIDSDRKDATETCFALCVDHGGPSGQGVGPKNNACVPPRRGGPDLLICVCADGHEDSLCADLWCVSEAQRQRLCEPSCEGHGGMVGSSCQELVQDPCIAPFGP